MLQPLQEFSDNQPTSIEPMSFVHPFDNQFHQQNHLSETQPTFNQNPYRNGAEKISSASSNMVSQLQSTQGPIDNACNQTEAHESLPPTTDAEKSTIGSKMQELIKLLSANYAPMKTPLEVGTPEYLKLVEILQQKNDSVPAPRKTDENKLSSEKLWDGSLRLSSSVTLSATAFFKSGEKLVGNKWPESIQVKGKVRLEAFEKYVQDLPRSRNRGLMVTSVCWKEGTSDTGLTGMKEVAKGYKKTSRVGFAQLLSGIDLYICPRSNPIITILAKYGFFKGMGVLDHKQDSMIGCVVWRKNRPLNPLENKTSPDSPSTLSINQTPESSQLHQPLTLKLTSNTETINNIAEIDHSNSGDSCKRPFQDDDLPEFDFGVGKTSHGQKLENSGFTQLTNTLKRNMGEACLDQSSKKAKLFDDDDNDMPEWCPPVVHHQTPPQTTTVNFQTLPPLPPIPVPRVDTRPSFSYQFRPLITCPPPLPPPPPLPAGSYGRFNHSQALWHPPALCNAYPSFPRPPQP